MQYVKVDTSYPKPRRELDLGRFTLDLAKALGGVTVSEDYGRSRIEVEDFRITLDAIWNDPTKVALHIRGSKSDWLGGNEPSGDDYRFPSIRVGVERPMERLVADVRRRLIEPARAPLAKRVEHITKLNASKSNLATVAANLRQQWPELSVHVDKDAVHNGTVYHNGEGTPYLSGRVYADGKVSVDHLGPLSAEQFDRFMHALYGTK